MKVSIIVPVYNTARFLHQCVDSILAQTMKDFEAIFVDDGSTDDSYAILGQYAEKDPRVSVFKQQNQYAGAARNAGMARAKGEYLMFLDSDDFYEPDLLEHMVAQIEKVNADFCVCLGRVYVNDTGVYSEPTMLYQSMTPKKEVFSRKELGEDMFGFSITGPTNKMFRRSFIEAHHLTFQAIQHANDVFFVCASTAIADRITVYDQKPLVYYRKNGGGNIQANVHREPLAFTNAIAGLSQFLHDKGLFDECKAGFDNLIANELKGYIVRNAAYPEAYRKIFDWYRTTRDGLMNFDPKLLKSRQMTDMLVVFDGVSLDMDAETSRKLICENIKRYDGVLHGGRVARGKFLIRKLCERCGLARGLPWGTRLLLRDIIKTFRCR